MSSQSETGHAKNVANFENLVTNVTGFGTVYNPSKESIKLSALNTLLASAKAVIGEVNTAESAYKNAVSAREVAFSPLSKFITRVINSLKSSDSSSQIDEKGMSLVRKLQGRRATPKLTDEEKKTIEAQGKEVNQVSASQLSIDSRLDNFDKLIKLLASEPAYSPNEPD